jgi:hypothetical protein
MKKKFLITFVLATMIAGCTPQATPIPEPTADLNALVGTMMAATLTAIAPTPAPPTQTPAPEPTATQLPPGTLQEEFGAGFTYPNATIWSDPFDTARVNVKHNYTVTAEQDYLKYTLNDPETYLYTFYQKEMPADVSIETSYLDVDTQSSEASVVCRADPTLTKFYEFRIVHFEKAGVIYYFEKSVYYDQYKKLAYAKLPVELFRDKENRLEGRCQGNTLTLFLNGQQVVSVQDSKISSGGFVGLGGMSHKKVPMTISFNYMNVVPAQ